ncbi:hypothetical protein RhiirB3_486654 [Rhizophagus irregularis]|nr:hypothetical protein RhiirB3_486654 [Rhizophagus irregularis]
MDFSRWVKVREYNCLKRKSTKKTKNPFLDNLPEYDISGSYFSLPGRGILVIVLSFVYLDAWKFGRKKKWEWLLLQGFLKHAELRQIFISLDIDISIFFKQLSFWCGISVEKIKNDYEKIKNVSEIDEYDEFVK